MASEVSLFPGGKGNALVTPELLSALLGVNKTLAGSSAAPPRISIRGGRFREIIGGEQTRVFKGDELHVIIVDAAPVGRTYFEGTYDPNNPTPPTCWSADTRVPHPDVPEENRMSSTCATCPMHVKGSGQNDSRACRFSQRLAVMVAGDAQKTVYQLQLPATSIFGDGAQGRYGMQAYAKLLHQHQTPVIAIVTGVSFDEDVEQPKLFFKPVRPLDEEELQAALEAKDSEAAKLAIAMTVSAVDGVALPPPAKSEAKPAAAKTKAKAKPAAEDDEDEAPPPKAKAKAKPKPAVEDDEDEAPPPKAKTKAKPAAEEDDDEPPVKRASKAAPAPVATDLKSIISSWDDEDEEDEDDE